jgi:hypothetical protein
MLNPQQIDLSKGRFEIEPDAFEISGLSRVVRLHSDSHAQHHAPATHFP